ncbi:MAG: alpha/beta fold hydrolase [Parahaliea sp.]
MTTLLLVSITAIGLLALLYFAYPGWLFDRSIQMARRRAGIYRRQLTVNGWSWSYLDGGKAGAEPLVLIHGFGGDKDNWTRYAPFVTGHYRLIAPDLPGFGENDRRLHEDYGIDAQVGRLTDFLDALGIDKCHLGGNSMGGFIALQFALRHPGRLRSLSLFNNAGVSGAVESDLERIMAADPSATPLAVRSMADIDRLLELAAYRPRWIPRAFKRVMYRRFKTHEALLDRIFAQLLRRIEQDGGTMNDQLDGIETPTLILWGRHDRLLNVSCTEVLHAGIKGSELVILEDAGHVPMIEQPARTASAQLAFLTKHTGSLAVDLTDE